MPAKRLKTFLRSNLLFFLILALLWFGIRSWQQQDMLTGTPPVTQFTTLDGQRLKLEQLNCPCLIHFSASWCPVCQTQHGTLQALQQDWPVIHIITQSGNNDTVRTYARKHGMPLKRTVNDPQGSLLAQFGARGVPADFFVGRDGEIALHEMGYTSSWGYRIRLWWLAQWS